MNEENKKQFIILGGLALLLGGVLWQFVLKKDPQTAAMANPQAAAIGAPVESVFNESSVDLEGLVENIKVVKFDYSRQRDSRNPTLPLVGDHMAFRGQTAGLGSVPGTDDLLYEASRKKVTGIIWDELNPLAVIDDEVVAIGHEFDSPITVKSIERGRVILAIAGLDLDIVRELKEN